MFAEMDALMNSRVVELLADKEAYRQSALTGEIIGDPIPVLFSEPGANAFNGLMAGSKPTITIANTVAIALGDPLSIGGKSYRVDEITPSNGLNVIALEAV